MDKGDRVCIDRHNARMPSDVAERNGRYGEIFSSRPVDDSDEAETVIVRLADGRCLVVYRNDVRACDA